MKLPHEVERMGDALRREVERQLLVDLSHYRVGSSEGLVIDWSNVCQEGHYTMFMGAMLEELSSVLVRDANGVAIADGWMDFVHGDDALPLHVFWSFLDILDSGRHTAVKSPHEIPLHVWSRLSDSSKDAQSLGGKYDSRWKRDPKVIAWHRGRGRT